MDGYSFGKSLSKAIAWACVAAFCFGALTAIVAMLIFM